MPNMSDIGFTNEDYLMRPKGQAVYPIKARELQRLEKMIGKLSPPGGFFQNLGFCALGVAISALCFLISLRYSQNVATAAWIAAWVIFLVSTITTVGAFKVSHKDKQSLEVSKQEILDEITSLKESLYDPQNETSSLQPVPEHSDK